MLIFTKYARYNKSIFTIQQQKNIIATDWFGRDEIALLETSLWISVAVRYW